LLVDVRRKLGCDLLVVAGRLGIGDAFLRRALVVALDEVLNAGALSAGRQLIEKVHGVPPRCGDAVLRPNERLQEPCRARRGKTGTELVQLRAEIRDPRDRSGQKAVPQSTLRTTPDLTGCCFAARRWPDRVIGGVGKKYQSC
jgi:hypothetical protein